MARSQTQDFIQSFRFHVIVIDTGGLGFNPLEAVREGSAGVEGEAGFQSVTIPEISTDAAEYREGIMKWTRKLPGPPTLSDITMMRGVVKKDTSFFDWGVRTATGGDYRVDLAILQYGREDVDPGTSESVPQQASRIIKAYDCFPLRTKPAGDLDATSSEVSLSELDVATERIEIEVLN